MIQMVLFSIPEALVVTWLVQVLSGSHLSRYYLLTIGLLVGLIVAWIRPHMNSFLINMLIYACVLVALFSVFKAADLWKLLVSVAFALPIYLMIEFVNFLILGLFNVNAAETMNNLCLKLLCFIPQISVAVIITFLLSRYNLTLFLEEDKGV